MKTDRLSKNQAIVLQHYTTRDGYTFEISSNKWILSRNVTLGWDVIEKLCTIGFISTLKLLLANLATVNSAHTISAQLDRMIHYCRWHHQRQGRVAEIEPVSFANYRTELPLRQIWYVGVLTGTIRRWSERGYPGLAEGLLIMIDQWSTPGNAKGEAVQLQSPVDGALTDLEFEALHSAACAAFEQDECELEDFVILLLLSFSGRRTIQLCDLMTRDFIKAESDDGLVQAILNVPRAKQRGGAFRGEFTPFALSTDNALAVSALIASNERRLEALKKDSATPLSIEELPLFPNWKEVKYLLGRPAIDRELLPVDVLHSQSETISKSLQKLVKNLGVVSERTGEHLRVYPTRLRRTLGTRAAREGLSELVIARLLDHTDVQNVSVYTENVPEHIDPINKAVAAELALIAQAFSGRLVDKESDARRGDDPSSRVRSQSGDSTGTCGHHGFCGALAPVACYTCKSFQPWVDGPHEAVLDFLLTENKRVHEATGDLQIANIWNRTILAVTRVIQLCADRKAELARK